MNPDLTWSKTVNGQRRSRKSAARKATGIAKDVECKAVSESEKLGVVVLGQHFKDDVEHVPIKKRRSIGQSLSPSPPPLQTTQPRVQDASRVAPRRNPTYRQKPSRSDASSVIVHEKISDMFMGKVGSFEDFSGIEILADVACSRAIRDDMYHVNGKLCTEERMLQEPKLPISVKPLVEEAGVSLSVVSSSHNDVVPEEEPKNTLFQGDHDIVSNKVIADEKITKMIHDRSHWDLNLPMEEWEKSCDFVNDDMCTEVVQDDASGTSSALEVCEFKREAEEYKEEDISNEVVLPDVIKNITLPSDSIDLHVSSDGSNVTENVAGGSSTESSSNCNECSFTIVDTSPDCLMLNKSDTKVSTQVVSTDALLNISASQHNGKRDNVESLESSEKSGSMSSYDDNVNHSTEYDSSDVGQSKLSFADLSLKKKSDLVSPRVEVSGEVNSTIDNTCNDGVELYANKSSAKDMIADIDSPYKSSNTTPEVASYEVANELPLIAVEDPSGDNYGGSDVSRKDKDHLDEQISADYQAADYESQFEDGELREIYPCWEDIDDCEEGNQLDYDESKEEKPCGSSESIENKTMVVNGSILETTYVNKNVLKSETSRMSDGGNMNQAPAVCMDGSGSSVYSSPRDRFDNFDDSYVRDESDAVSDRFKGKNRSPLRYCDSKRHSPIYNGPYSAHSRPRRPIDSSPGYMMGSDNTRKQFFNPPPPSNRAYHNVERRTRPVDRDYSYDGGILHHTGISPNRDARRYHQQENITEYYGRRPQQRSIKRDRSISPPVGGRPYYTRRPYNKSQLSFRSRSPASRRHSGMPNFRPDDKKEGANMFFNKRFVADSEDDSFVSLPRNQHFVHRDNTRWNSTVNNFKNKKSSPGRMMVHHQNGNQKFDSERYFHRGDSGTRPRRFQDMVSGGPRKYEGIENGKYENNKYDVIHRPRRYNRDVPARRFRYDAEDSHVVNDS